MPIFIDIHVSRNDQMGPLPTECHTYVLNKLLGWEERHFDVILGNSEKVSANNLQKVRGNSGKVEVENSRKFQRMKFFKNYFVAQVDHKYFFGI